MFQRSGNYVLIEPPSDELEVVSLEQMKLQAHVDSADEEELIEEYRDAAVESVESDTSLKLLDQQQELHLDGFCSEIRIEMGPVSTINSIKYQDANNQEQTVPEDVYEVDLSDPHPRIRCKVGQSWPPTYKCYNAVKVNFNVGYEAVEDIPKGLKAAARLLATVWFKNREALVDKKLEELPSPAGYWSLIRRFRIRGR